MTSYTVTWSVSVNTDPLDNGDTPLDAARQALGIMQDPGNTATWFHVTNDETHESVMVDADDGTTRPLNDSGELDWSRNGDVAAALAGGWDANYPPADDEPCGDTCTIHAHGCDGFCDHLAGHYNACMVAEYDRTHPSIPQGSNQPA